MATRYGRRVWVLLGLVLMMSAPASAHHEAMFGPQSAAVLSPTMFLSFQVFDKEEGDGHNRRRETTTVYSIGFTPLKKRPLSVVFVLPATFAGGVADPRPRVRRPADSKTRC